MAIFGLITQREMQARLDALKADIMPQLHTWLLETADAERYNLGDPSAFDEPLTLYRKLSWILQAVDNTAAAGALARFDIKRVIQDKEPKDIPNHPFEMLLRNPNPLDSRYEFLYATIAMYKLTGNAYWWLNRTDENSPPDEMWLIPSHMIIPVPDERMYLRGYLYYPGNGREMLMQPHEIVHFRRMNPFSRFLGLSAVESIVILAKGDLAMQQWNTNLFNKANGMLPGILAFEQMVADPTWEKIKKDTKEAQANRSLLMLRGVGQGASAKGGVSWLQNNVSQKDMEFLEGRKATGKEIMDTLAPGLYTWLAGESTYSNAGANRAAFNELTLYPMHVMMAEKITNGILPAYGSDNSRPLIGMFEDVRMADKQMEINEIVEYSKTHTIKEIREEWYSDDPLGDERDDLLPEQIKPESGGIQEPPPAPVVEGATPDKPPAAPEAPKEEEKPVKSELDDELGKWERKALKRIGKPVEFISHLIPDDINRFVEGELPACKNELAVKMVFNRARVMAKPKPEPVTATTDILKLADAINLLAAKYTNQTPVYPNPFQSAQTFNLPPTENTFNLVMPNQDAPQTHVNITPQIEAARQPDVHVSSPVNIQQTIEPAPAPNVETPIIVNNTVEAQEPMKLEFPVQPAPVVNITNQLPELPAPNVTVENKVEPTPIQNTVNVEPTPIENKVEVKTPKLKRSKDKIQRDEANNIDGKTTEYDYEE